MGVIRVFGAHALARLTLRGVDDAPDRLERFNHRMLVALLLVLYLVYPGVSVAIFGIFSCTELGGGVWFLDADVRIVCYSPKHWGYLGAGVVWVCVYTIGIPVFFLWLLHHFRVPHLARQLEENAWLRELVKLALLEGMEQGTELNLISLTTDSITDTHLEALHAFFLQGVPPEQAHAILAGEQEPLPDPPVETAPAPGLLSRMYARVAAAWFDDDAVEPGAARRAELLAHLLVWVRSIGVVAIPALEWEEDDDDKPDASLPAKSRSMERQVSKVQATESQTRQRQEALRKVGFLFAVYKPEFYFWEVVELGRKLALTSILALIAPGTAGQVVVGLLLALFMLLLNSRFKPYAAELLNSVNVYAQLNLTLFLLVALLLKVDLDQRGSASFYTGIVAFLSIVPVLLPMLLLLLMLNVSSSTGGSTFAASRILGWEEE